MVGHAGTPTGTVHADVTLTRSNVKVKVTELFELPTISEAVHDGGNDRSPLSGLSGIISSCFFCETLARLKLGYVALKLTKLFIH